MRKTKYISVVALLYLATSASVVFAHVDVRANLLHDGKTATNLIRTGTGTHTYESVPHWCQLPKDATRLGNTHGNIIIDAAGSVYFNTDTERSVMVYQADGAFGLKFSVVDGFFGLLKRYNLNTFFVLE